MTSVSHPHRPSGYPETTPRSVFPRRPVMVRCARLVTTALTLLVAGCGGSSPGSSPTPISSPPKAATKVYVAVEDDGAVAVLDGTDLHLLATIPLGDYMAHNVQVAPDGKSVWVTLPAMEMGGMAMPDQVAIIDP